MNRSELIEIVITEVWLDGIEISCLQQLQFSRVTVTPCNIMFSFSKLHILGLLLAVTLWPTFVLSQDIQARANANPIPCLEGYNVTVEKNPKWQAILVKSFDHKATPTLTTTITMSGHPTAFTIKPTDKAVQPATISGTAFGHPVTYLCYPIYAHINGVTADNCMAGAITTLGILHVGSETLTPNPTGFAVGTGTLTPGGKTTVGTHTLSLGPIGGLFIDGSSSHIDYTIPPAKATTTKKADTTTTKKADTTTTKKADTTTTKKAATTTSAAQHPAHTGDIVFTVGTLTVTAKPTGFKVGTATLKPGGHVTVGTETLSLPTGGGAIVIQGSTVPFKTVPQTLTGTHVKPGPTTTAAQHPAHTGDIVFTVGTLTVTAKPTGFKVGTATLKPGGHVSVGTETLSLPTGGGAIVIQGSTVPFKTVPQTLTGTHVKPGPTTTAVQHPSRTGGIVFTAGTLTVTAKPTGFKVGTATLTPGGHVTVGTETISLKTGGAGIIIQGSTVPFETIPQTLGGVTRTRASTGTSQTTHKTAQETHEVLTLGTLTVTADPTGFQVGTTTLIPGGVVTVGKETLSLPKGGGGVIVDGTRTIPFTHSTTSTKSKTSTTSTTSHQSWTTISGSSTTGLYGIIIVPQFTSLTAPVTTTMTYIDHTKTTSGPVFVGAGGIVLQSWPPSTDVQHGSGGGLIIPDPIKPSTNELKCPSFLKWLCGPSSTSSHESGSDVNPGDEPNSNPKDDPNKTKNPTTEPTSHESTTSEKTTSSKTSTETTSTCTKTQVKDCEVTCSPTVISSKTTTTCFTTACSTTEACSKTGHTSTTTITSSGPCATMKSLACGPMPDETVWVHPDQDLDTALLNSLASSIMASDASDMNDISSGFAQARSSLTATTLTTATATSTSTENTSTKTTHHTAPSTTSTGTHTKTTTSTSSTTTTLGCLHQCPQNHECNCYCPESPDNLYQIMSSTSGMTSYQPCGWTTLPPLDTSANVGPLTITETNGDVSYCATAHYSASTNSNKKCVGSMTAVPTSVHTTATSTKTSFVATGTGKPYAELYIGIIVQNGGAISDWSWNVYAPKVGDTPNWCDDSLGSQDESNGNIDRYWYPPDITFKDLDGDLSKSSWSNCKYTGDSNHKKAGSLDCGQGVIACTGDFPDSDDSSTCAGFQYAGSAFPRVYCKWYVS